METLLFVVTRHEGKGKGKEHSHLTTVWQLQSLWVGSCSTSCRGYKQVEV